MNNLELANSALADVKSHNRSDAIKKIKKLLEADADLKDNWGGLTRLAISIGEFKTAISCSKNYLAINPNEPKRIIQSAAILAECRQVKEAIELVSPLLKGQPTPDILHFLGTTHSQIGNIEIAKEFLIKLLDIVPKSAISWLTLSAIYKFQLNDEIYSKITSIKHDFNNNKTQSAPFWFALGKAELDVNNSEKAFSHFAHGCGLMNNENTYSEQQHCDFINEIIAKQTKAFLDSLPSIHNKETNQPIFIVGLPRSGTTLLQQILSAHTNIGEGGELKYLTYSFAEIGQSNINKLSSENDENKLAILNKIQEDYSHLRSQQFSNNLPIIDKTLNLNHQLGIISKVFPNATIIRIVRNSEDNAWSCFRNFFNQGNNWSYNLRNIASFFHHEERLAEHWQSLLGARIIQISYEDLIESPESTIKLCLANLGLDFESDILSFHKKKSLVQTASVGQVRKPLHADSVNSNVQVKKHLKPFSSYKQQLRSN